MAGHWSCYYLNNDIFHNRQLIWPNIKQLTFIHINHETVCNNITFFSKNTNVLFNWIKIEYLWKYSSIKTVKIWIMKFFIRDSLFYWTLEHLILFVSFMKKCVIMWTFFIEITKKLFNSTKTSWKSSLIVHH